jgi:hypothetical protein
MFVFEYTSIFLTTNSSNLWVLRHSVSIPCNVKRFTTYITLSFTLLCRYNRRLAYSGLPLRRIAPISIFVFGCTSIFLAINYTEFAGKPNHYLPGFISTVLPLYNPSS